MTRTLWDVLSSTTDRHGRKGRQLPLPAILTIANAAMLAGAKDLRAIFRWGRRLSPEALALFGIKRAPCHAITGDAIFCQREICRTITDASGDYLFAVKDNQPEMKEAVAVVTGRIL